MIRNWKSSPLIPVLALSLTLATSASLHAQDRRYQGSNNTSTTLQINLGTTPHWSPIGANGVQEIRAGERPDYDMFRYRNSYYVYDNNRWYTSRQGRGQFTYIDDSAVPRELSMVPRDHWRNYPSQWQGRDNQVDDRTNSTMEVTFGSAPRWNTIRGTRVQEIRQGQRPGYDMFRYGNTYYIYNNNRWYMSRQWRGSFTYIDDRFVPRELRMVPRNHWRNYPQGWANQNDDGRNGRGGRRYH